MAPQTGDGPGRVVEERDVVPLLSGAGVRTRVTGGAPGVPLTVESQDCRGNPTPRYPPWKNPLPIYITIVGKHRKTPLHVPFLTVFPALTTLPSCRTSQDFRRTIFLKSKQDSRDVSTSSQNPGPIWVHGQSFRVLYLRLTPRTPDGGP